MLLTAQPSKIEFLREKFEKSRDFAREKTKLDAGSEANSAASFVFSRAKSRLFETFRVRTRFYEDGLAITVVITSCLFFHVIWAVVAYELGGSVGSGGPGASVSLRVRGSRSFRLNKSIAQKAKADHVGDLKFVESSAEDFNWDGLDWDILGDENLGGSCSSAACA